MWSVDPLIILLGMGYNTNLSIICLHVLKDWSVIKCDVVFFRIWDVECGSCLRLLEGHEELVRYDIDH